MEKKEFTLETFERIIDKVVFWNSLAGNLPEDRGLEKIYLQLSREEFFGQNEFLQGWFTGDKVMQADGVGDLLFTAGMLSRIVNDTQIIFKPSELNQLVVIEVVQHLSGDLINWAESVYDSLFGLCYKMSEVMDVESIFEVIYQSNVSKYVHTDNLYGGFCLDGEVQAIESQGRYAEVDYKLVGDYYVFTALRDVKSGVVFDKPKIVKSSLFKDVEGLEEFIY
ncbi:conserved hypothetical protein [Vibrio phage 501E54-1]|nr:conserved hypothetical protein [Vibrio phage 501E54-1]